MKPVQAVSRSTFQALVGVQQVYSDLEASVAARVAYVVSLIADKPPEGRLDFHVFGSERIVRWWPAGDRHTGGGVFSTGLLHNDELLQNHINRKQNATP